MVLAKRLERHWRLQEKREVQRVQRRWEAWNRRRMEAESRGETFDEPPPQLETDSAKD